MSRYTTVRTAILHGYEYEYPHCCHEVVTVGGVQYLRPWGEHATYQCFRRDNLEEVTDGDLLDSIRETDEVDEILTCDCCPFVKECSCDALEEPFEVSDDDPDEYTEDELLDYP